MTPPSLLPLTIFANLKFLKHRRFPLRKVLVLWHRKNLTKSHYTRPHLSFLNCFVTWIFLKERKDSIHLSFGTVGQKTSDKSRYRSLWPNKFWKRQISETLNKGMLYEVFRFCERRQIRRKVVTPPSLLPLTIFATRIFLKHRRVPLQKLLVLWEKTIFMQKRDSRPLSNT